MMTAGRRSGLICRPRRTGGGRFITNRGSGMLILRRKKKNRYCGVKEFGGVSDVRYFKLFDETEEYCFQFFLTERDPAEILPILQDINARINKAGYWLYDWA